MVVPQQEDKIQRRKVDNHEELNLPPFEKGTVDRTAEPPRRSEVIPSLPYH
jgi:hypothetical protein